jgi:hypothetical protein
MLIGERGLKVCYKNLVKDLFWHRLVILNETNNLFFQ